MVRRYFAISLLVFTALGLTAVPPARSACDASSRRTWTAADSVEGFVYEAQDGEFLCRPAGPGDAVLLETDREGSGLHVINRPEYQMQAAGELTIVLRGTAQLDSFPAARDGFLRAADNWSQRIQAPITIIIDVDFGTTRFGQAYPPNVLGSTSSQTLVNSDGYSDVRAGLISRATDSEEVGLVNSLPNGQVPTDIGSTAGLVAPSALLRALGVLAPVADPPSEPGFGSPPSIGFNSNFSFDFDPSNGIDSDKIDFDAVATHEIAHALGFSSRVGALELNPQTTMALSVLDLFRFRPGTSLSSFGTAPRVLSSGGTQMFFNGQRDVELSTGRPDGSGGDNNQASHWKDSRIVQPPIGVMVPGLARGERQTITDNDIRALDLMGYSPSG